MIAAWLCQNCPMNGSGLTWADADRAAEKHTKATTHATRTWTVGAIRSRDEAGVVRNEKPKGT